jgi:beta-N-acetylhexosaminidase
MTEHPKGIMISKPEQIQSMPIELQVGQLFVVQPDPDAAYDDALNAHLEHYFGGFFLRSANLQSIRNARVLTRRMREHWQKVPPAIIAADEEGGLVSDIGHLTTPAPSAAALGEIDDVEVTEDVYRGIGEKLRALGINTVFAPVLDVNSAEHNPVIGTRAFGRTARHVTKHGLAALRGLKKAGVATCAKHFPGHGATEEDSHETLPKVGADRSTLTDRDLAPFVEAIERETPDLIMAAHVKYPAFDRSRPATVSRAILRDLLRTELHYKGLIITDAMEMKGIAGNRTPAEAAVEAVLAGADLLLYAYDREMARAAHAGVLAAAQKGTISEERLVESLERIFAFRSGLRSRSWIGPTEAKDTLEFAEEPLFFEAAMGGLVVEGNAGVLSEIRAATGSKVMILPRALDKWRKLPLDVVREQMEPAGFSIIEVGADPTPEEILAASGRAGDASVVVVGTASRGGMPPRAKELVDAVTSRDVIKVGVALLDPTDADAMMGANCRLKTFGFTVPQLWAMCQKLLG